MASLFSSDDRSLNDDDISAINLSVERSISSLHSILRSSINSATVVSQTASCLKELAKIQPLDGEYSEPIINLGYTDNVIILKKFGKEFALLFNRHRQFYNKSDVLSLLGVLSDHLNVLKKDIEAELKTIFENEKVNSKYFPLSKDTLLLGVTLDETNLTILYMKDKLDAIDSTISQSKKNIVKLYLEFITMLLMCLIILSENIYSTEAAINSEVSKELALLKDESTNEIRCCNIEPTKLSIFKLLSLSYHKFSIDAQKESTFQDLSRLMTIIKETLDDAVSEDVKDFFFDGELVKIESIIHTE